ncbi:MAG TPA: hypothetical protein VH592_22320 [Gemmataceae bacterium]|jgi:hypothetical protein
MPSIKLSRYEAEEGSLPDVCMCCGVEATERKRRRFVSHPLWVYVLMPFGYIPYVIVAAILTEHIRCYTLFCPRHKNYYRSRNLIVWGALVLVLFLIIGGLILAFSLSSHVSESTQELLAGSTCLGSVLLLLLWLISIPISQETAIHPTKATEHHVTLKCVCPAFAEAVQQYRADRKDQSQTDEVRQRSRPRRSPDIRTGDDDRIQPS